jgi:heat shock protein HslJ
MKTLLAIIICLSAITACNNENKEQTAKNADTAAATAPPAAALPATIEMTPAINGSWELTYISGTKIAFEGLYPNKKPAINFDVANTRVSGNTGCNNFSGKLNIDGNKINLNEAMALTKMMCPGQGETIFLETLKKINTYSVSDDSTLNFIMGDIALMRFKRK